MIPYEDLVAALQAWRVKQGLPVGMMSPPMPSSSSTPLLGSRSISSSMSATPAPAPARTAPPAPPPSARPGPPGPPPRSPTPPPLAPPPDSVDEPVDDSALLEEAHYENEGGDFAMAFSREPGQPDGEPEGTTVDDPSGTAPRQKPPRNHDW